MDNIREKLVDALKKCGVCNQYAVVQLADALAANGVTVQTEDEKRNALNEAYDLGVDSVLHDHFGLSWRDAAELRKEVKRLQDATKWIPVSERLPDETKDEYVLAVCDYYGKINVETRKMWHIDACVTHWMPLPLPPKGE